jgi:colanic acid/amylovoran biosynthesis glycosyltransferase
MLYIGTNHMNDTTLVVVSPLKGVPLSSGTIVLTQKFADGMKLYREFWGGPILHLCEPGALSDSLDNIEVPIKNAEFDTICSPLSPRYLKSVLPQRSIVLASVGEQFNSISAICREIDVPCVYITEYNLKTRLQIVSEYQRNALRGAWSSLRQVQQEIAQRKAISLASGTQCNGLPTFCAYKSINANAHLFFDSRTDSAMLANHEQITRRSFDRRQGKKLQLAFSGRLNLMKGVDDLILVAEHLRRLLNGWFHLSICGDGEYAPQLRRDIEQNGLGDLVSLRGTLDFKTELVPFIRNETDLFVCCHRQGDPSCTYLETMACGVPVAGYANDAWSALASVSQAGWATPIGDPETLANEIARLNRSDYEIEAASIRALDFATEHTFDKTFRRRVEHLTQTAAEHYRQCAARRA